MSARRFTVTSGLPYSNGRLHVGHVAGAYLPADTWVRYLRARGDDVLFVCGSDDNGVASLISARKEGRPVEELTAFYNARQAADFEGLGIRFDVYGGTHQPGFVETHERLSRAMFRTIHDRGYFAKRATQQLFDPAAGQFLPDRYVRGRCYHHLPDGTPCGYEDAYGDQCEQCGNAIDPMKLVDPVSTITGARPEPRETVHWYLQLGRFDRPLADWLAAKGEPGEHGPAWRDTVLRFALGQIRQGLPERAMTRDLAWGVPVPLDDPDAAGKVLYVWFDAPIGYLSFTAELLTRRGEGPDAWERWWKDPDCRIVHFIGEDNTVFHALIWPAMLMAEGSYRLPSQVVANSFLNIKFPGREETKISKSRGTAVWIEDYLRRFDPDPLRYYLTAIAPESSRTSFDFEDFVARNNGELLATLGNFVNRTVTFAVRNFEGRVPEPGPLTAVDAEQAGRIRERHARVTEHLEGFRFRAALAEIMALARDGNVYMDAKKPWTEKKTDPQACATTVHMLLRTVRALTVLMGPFLPFSAEASARMLALPEGPQRWESALEALPGGHVLGEPRILFRKIEPSEIEDGA